MRTKYETVYFKEEDNDYWECLEFGTNNKEGYVWYDKVLKEHTFEPGHDDSFTQGKLADITIFLIQLNRNKRAKNE